MSLRPCLCFNNVPDLRVEGEAVTTVVKTIISLLGLIFLVLGLRCISDPAATGLEFGIAALEPKGLATLRADMFALFWTGGLTMIAAMVVEGGSAVLLLPASQILPASRQSASA